jgi:SAM-dependent methyltransferase
MLICPNCRARLETHDSGPLTCPCGESYPRLPSGGPDFLQGTAFADFDYDEDDFEQQLLLGQEAAGVSARVQDFLLPLLREYSRSRGKELSHLTVLDCGCGNGLSVDLLSKRGIHAWGIDAGRSRQQQWEQREARAHLVSANALRLPFADATFDAVLSSGLVEHIGIHEEEIDGYRSYRLQDCDRQRRQFALELIRVMKNDGFVMLDHPNGAFPADFWHGGAAGSLRWHSPFHDMLPRFREITRYFHAADPSLQFRSLSPSRRLSFQKVGAHWYGRIFAPLMKTWLEAMDLRPFSFLARSCLNPYLVTLISRQPRPRQLKSF